MTLPHDLLLTHRAFLSRLAHGLVHDDHADDLVQETLLTAVRTPPAQSGTLRVWLTRVAHNLASKMRRSERRRAAREGRHGGPAAATTPAEMAAQQELIGVVAAAVRDLVEPYRSVIHLRYYEGLTPQQIGERTGTPVTTVKTRLRRALEQLRLVLDRGRAREHWTGTLAVLAIPARETTEAAPLLPLMIKVVAAALATVAVVSWWRVPEAVPPGTANGPAASLAAVGTTGLAVAGSRERTAGVVRADGVRGRTQLENGDPAPGVTLSCCIGRVPGGGAGQYQRIEPVTSAADGTFTVAVAAGTEVMILVDDWRWRLAAEAPPTVVAPAEAPVVLRRVPTGRVLVYAADLDAGTPLQSFRCRFHVPAAGSDWPMPGQSFRGGFRSEATETGVIEFFVPCDDAATPGRVQIDLVEPGAARERVVVRAETTLRVDLGLRHGERVRGVVVDANGGPIADALVFAGTQVRARGDEPGKPFRSDRIRDGVRTDPQGAFELPVGGDHLTVWHAQWSPRTVRVGQAARIELQPLASLQGRLLGADGRPRADTELRLDRSRSLRTDANGVFSVAGVERGARLLHVPGPNADKLTATAGGPWIVHVGAAGLTDVVLAAGFAELRLGITGHDGAHTAALVGLGAGGSLAVGAITQDLLVVSHVVPGDYVLVTDRGAVQRLAIAGPTAQVQLGEAPADCWLVVEVADDRPLHVVPADADDMVRTLVARIVRRRRDASGTLRLGPFAPGDHEVCRGDEPFGELVRVAGTDTRMRLP